MCLAKQGSIAICAAFLSFLFCAPNAQAAVKKASSLTDTEVWLVKTSAGHSYQWTKLSGDPPGPEYFEDTALSFNQSATETMYRNSKTSGTVISYRTACEPESSSCDCTWTGMISGQAANGTVYCDGSSEPNTWTAIISNNE